jgi:hypothetical protein
MILAIAALTVGSAVAVAFVVAAGVATLVRALDRNDLERVPPAAEGDFRVADLFAALDEFSLVDEPEWWPEFEHDFADFVTTWRRGRAP